MKLVTKIESAGANQNNDGESACLYINIEAIGRTIVSKEIA